MENASLAVREMILMMNQREAELQKRYRRRCVLLCWLSWAGWVCPICDCAECFLLVASWNGLLSVCINSNQRPIPGLAIGLAVHPLWSGLCCLCCRLAACSVSIVDLDFLHKWICCFVCRLLGLCC